MNQLELFDESGTGVVLSPSDDSAAASAAAAATAAELFELSVDAYYTALYARMSELPLAGKITRYVERVVSAASGLTDTAKAREAASRAASDRGDPDTLVILETAGRVQHEVHRLTGLLRFSPDSRGVYIARCGPDYFILPALAEHFTLRFGETPWAIIDEKRKLCLCRENDGPAVLVPAPEAVEDPAKDSCEDLWRLYHRSINNEARKNPHLQRQLMPVRYQKYLPEMQ